MTVVTLQLYRLGRCFGCLAECWLFFFSLVRRCVSLFSGVCPQGVGLPVAFTLLLVLLFCLFVLFCFSVLCLTQGFVFLCFSFSFFVCFVLCVRSTTSPVGRVCVSCLVFFFMFFHLLGVVLWLASPPFLRVYFLGRCPVRFVSCHLHRVCFLRGGCPVWLASYLLLRVCPLLRSCPACLRSMSELLPLCKPF